MKKILSILMLSSVLAGADEPSPSYVPEELFSLPGDLEIKVWAKTPLFYNPVNMDVDSQGRIWVIEGMNYSPRSQLNKKGDRVMVIADSDGDGVADKSHMFVQEEGFQTAMGVAVIGNRVFVSQPPALIVYTDVDGDAVFDPKTDTREEFLSGFAGFDHGHGLHELFTGPDGQFYLTAGNYTSGEIKDRGGRTFRIGSFYGIEASQKYAGHKSDDGHVYVGGIAYRVKADGTGLNVVAHNMRNPVGLALDSYGNIFNNDNDDPPCCRTSWLQEYANLGYASDDGKRHWSLFKRPGQSKPSAHWRQLDPGTAPAGDVYGFGAPTGMAVYENGALPEKYRGLVMSCETVRNAVLGYYPKAKGAGMEMERFNFLTTNPDEKIIGADASRDENWEKNVVLNNWFRPSDVVVGPDGAIYVADWFDPRVGGHHFLDEKGYGTIYRIAPRGASLAVPKIDLGTVEGQMAVLKNPAVNVRYLGFAALVKSGDRAVPALKKMLEDENPFLAARAIWVLPHSAAGLPVARQLLSSKDEPFRLTALRALRRAEKLTLTDIAQSAGDPSMAVRREAAISLRDIPFESSKEIILALAGSYGGNDKNFLEALGTACEQQESQAFLYLKEKLAAKGDWSDAFAEIVWRLHPGEAIPDLVQRASNDKLGMEQRRRAMETLAFIPQREAAEAMLQIALGGADELREQAKFWVKNRGTGDWRAYKTAEKLGSEKAGQVVVTADKNSQLPSIDKILTLKGNAVNGKKLFLGKAACSACHQIDGKGLDFGPDLTAAAKILDRRNLIEAIVHPSAGIALGFEGVTIHGKDGTTVSGFIKASGDPLVMQTPGGVQVAVDKKNIGKVEKLKDSLMPPASALGLSAQDVVDLQAFLVNPLGVKTAKAGHQTTQTTKVLILTGMEHPAHDWKTRTAALQQLLAKDDRFEVAVETDPEFLAQQDLFQYDVILMNFYSGEKGYPGKASRENLLKFVAEQGKGLFILHFACGNFHDWPEYAGLSGLVFTPDHGRGPGHHDRRQPFVVKIVDRDHPVSKGLKPELQADDECYYCLGGATREYDLIATARSEVIQKDQPMALCLQYGKGRVFNTPLGHDAKAVKMPDVAELIRRGLLWSAGK